MSTQNIITLTTIPPRFETILPTLQSLLDQDADIARVVLAIPRSYNRRAFGAVADPVVPEGIEILRCDLDYGPATKLLPALANYRGQDVRLLYCDDDRIYARDWAQRLIAHNQGHPEEAAIDAGDPVAAIDLRATRDTALHRRLNAITLGLSGKSHRRAVRRLIPDDGRVDIAKGYGGVLIRPEFLDDAVFSIPENFWAVDDIWLSGHLARQGVRVHKVGRDPRSRRTDAAKRAALLDLELDGLGRDKLNLACVNYFRSQYGIWGGSEAV